MHNNLLKVATENTSKFAIPDHHSGDVSNETFFLGEGVVMVVQVSDFDLTLPHAFHSNIEKEIAFRHPRAEVLINRRIGYLGASNPVRYSMFAYIRNRRSRHIRALGAALDNREAWSFNALIPRQASYLGLARILEQIAALPVQIVPTRKNPTAVGQ